MKHPALDLFSRLFDEMARDPGPRLPGDFVPRSTFQSALRLAEIESPENIVEFWEWEETIGLREHVRKTIKAYHRKHGTTPTPMERGAMRLERQMKKGTP